MDPRNGFAQSHLGFILKTDHLRYIEAIPLLRNGISSGEAGADDGRFYFHLGDAFTRIGRPDEVRNLVLTKCWVTLCQNYLKFCVKNLVLFFPDN